MKNFLFLTFILTFLVFSGYTQTKENKPLPVGKKAPFFSGKDQNGNEIKLSKILSEGPVVLVFYRGEWCPYCEKHVSEIQENLNAINKKNGQVVLITPEQPESIKKMIKKTDASFPIIHDKNYSIMKAYKVAFKPEKHDGMLPVPATYIIDTSGNIAWYHFDKDYKFRSSIEDILGNLH